MKKNLFEIGAKFDDAWSTDNKQKEPKNELHETKPPEKHHLHFAREKRRGKTVTIVKPFFLEKKELQALLKTLKKRVGTGGTVKENRLEFQGEVEEKVRLILMEMGYRFKT